MVGQTLEQLSQVNSVPRFPFFLPPSSPTTSESGTELDNGLSSEADPGESDRPASADAALKWKSISARNSNGLRVSRIRTWGRANTYELVRAAASRASLARRRACDVLDKRRAFSPFWIAGPRSSVLCDAPL